MGLESFLISQSIEKTVVREKTGCGSHISFFSLPFVSSGIVGSKVSVFCAYTIDTYMKEDKEDIYIYIYIYIYILTAGLYATIIMCHWNGISFSNSLFKWFIYQGSLKGLVYVAIMNTVSYWTLQIQPLCRPYWPEILIYQTLLFTFTYQAYY